MLIYDTYIFINLTKINLQIPPVILMAGGFYFVNGNAHFILLMNKLIYITK